MRDTWYRRLLPAIFLSTAALLATWLRLRPRPAPPPDWPAAPTPAPVTVIAVPNDSTPPPATPAPEPASPITPRVTRPMSGAAKDALLWFVVLGALWLTAAVAVGTARQSEFHALLPLFVTAALATSGVWFGVNLWLKQNPTRQWPRWLWRFIGLGFAWVLAFVAADINFSAEANEVPAQIGSVLLWIVAIGLALASAWQRGDVVSSGLHQPIARWEVIGLIGLVSLAFVLRFVDVEHIPAMILGDETKYAIAARELLELGQVKPFTTGSDGHWNFYLQMVGLFMQLFGPTMFALRLPSVLAGTASLVATWAVVRVLWGRRPALIALALLAAFHHHLHYSRVGFNSIDDPLFSMLVFACTWLAWRTGRRRVWLMTALATGLSQYFFVGGRLVLIQLAVLAVFWLIFERRQVRAQALNIAVAVSVFVCMVMPIIYFIALRPDDYMGSLNAKNIYRSGWMPVQMALTGESEAGVLWMQLRDVITSFSFGSDEAFYWNQTVLTPIMTILAVIALAYCAARWRAGPYFWIISSLSLLIIFGGLLMVSATAGSHRLLGSGPLIYAAIAVILDRAWSWAESRVRYRPAVAAAAIAVIGWLMWSDLQYYTVSYLAKNELRSPEVPLNLIHHYLLDLEPRTRGQSIQIACVALNTDHCRGTNIDYLARPLLARAAVVTDLVSVADAPPPDHRPLFLIINAALPEEIERAALLYPSATRRDLSDTFDNLFFVAFEVPPQ